MMNTLAPIDREVSAFPIDNDNDNDNDNGSGQLSMNLDQLLIELVLNLLMKMVSSANSGTSGTPGTSGSGTASASHPSTSTVPSVSSNNAAQAVASDLEQRYGLTPTQAAGVLGNMQQESSMECNVNQGGSRGEPN